jgi:hypothetical protein
MILIAHRGNIAGPNPTLENNPDYIKKTLAMGFEVEVDAWMKNGECYLGHDGMHYRTDINFLKNDRIWVHAKNIEGFLAFRWNTNCFMHSCDRATVTSCGYIWMFDYNKKIPTLSSIPELYNCICISPLLKFTKKNKRAIMHYSKYHGLCSDYVLDIRKALCV